MDKKSLAEALYLFGTIEELLRKKGATGESFSDLIKSYDTYQEDSDLKACQDFVNEVGYAFYYSMADGNYFIKENAPIELSDSDLERYRYCKEKIKAYYQYRDTLMDGFYKNLRAIGHERNQLLHIYDYKIENFGRFKKACFQVIRYLETGKRLPWDSIVDIKEKESVTSKRSHTNRHKRSISWKFLLKFMIVLGLLYGIDHYLGLCAGCEGVTLWGIYGVGSLVGALVIEKLWTLIWENIVLVVIILVMGYSLTHTNQHTRANTEHCEYYYVVPKVLNIREHPTAKSRKVGQLQHHAKVCVTEKKKRWYRIENSGWVSSSFLTKTGDL